MENFYFSGISIEDFLSRVKEIVETSLSNSEKGKPPDNTPKYLSRKEVTSLLKISLPTLHSWSKHGILKPHKLGNRVLFKQEEIESALAGIQKIKHKRNIL